MFHSVKKQSTSKWISLNIVYLFNKLKINAKKLILIPKSGDKKIEDYLFNIIKA
jgi:hypothetical protein